MVRSAFHRPQKSASCFLTPTLHFRYFERALKKELSGFHEGKVWHSGIENQKSD
jgi:hypothetical protein